MTKPYWVYDGVAVRVIRCFPDGTVEIVLRGERVRVPRESLVIDKSRKLFEIGG